MLTGCSCEFLQNKNVDKQDTMDNQKKKNDDKIIRGDDEMNNNEFVSKIYVTINEKKYSLILEDNATTRELFNNLPINFDIKELNGNEKYIYMKDHYTTNSSNPKHISKGDVMLYGSNCLVIFYKSFDTSYSYTRLGHIDNLEDLSSDDITVKFEK